MVSTITQKKEKKIKLLNIVSWYQFMAARFRERKNILIGCPSEQDGPLLSARDFPRLSRRKRTSHDSLKGFALLKKRAPGHKKLHVRW